MPREVTQKPPAARPVPAGAHPLRWTCSSTPRIRHTRNPWPPIRATCYARYATARPAKSRRAGITPAGW